MQDGLERRDIGVIEDPPEAPAHTLAGHLEGLVDSVAIGALAASPLGFWLRGVNFRPHFLHRRILRKPMVLVLRTPLLTESVDPHEHFGGLPLIIVNHLTGHARGLII